MENEVAVATEHVSMARMNIVEKFKPRTFEEALEDMLKNFEKNPRERWEIAIQPHDIGFTVRIGCKSIAFADKEVMLDAINEYFRDPEKSLRKYKNLWFNF